ncbi:aminopeptidase N-like [Condylostylus longicornis]|uniref:aminopeptidase N-like n=1 Tax=Condylostylus longicornis TaxID=2530218 RepID=UPI00244E400E|nr:aminopeptidase N-like [Condylostylus longicornis]
MIISRNILLTLFAIFFNSLINAQEFNLESYRLSNSTTPYLYEIDIEVNLDENNFKFNGSVEITFTVVRRTKEILLHYKDLNILKIEITSATSIAVENVYMNKTTAILLLQVNKFLEKGETHSFKITYDSILREGNIGFYRTWYLNRKGEKIWLAATAFSPIYARFAFPCYDEPNLKAAFQIRLKHSNNKIALSNQNVQSIIKNSDGTTTTEFVRTPKISTHSVAFFICDFGFTESSELYRNNALNNITHLTYYRSDIPVTEIDLLSSSITNAFYSLQNHLLADIQLLHKLQNILIPNIFSKTQSNWGIITFKEALIRFNSTRHWEREILSTTLLIGHEVSHQWFGNLITVEWWTWIWLNEGFATLFQYYITDDLHPTWNILEYYQIHILHSAFRNDFNRRYKLRPMNLYVEKMEDIQASFNKLPYNKASCVLRMFEHALGKPIFLRGLQYYIKERGYKSSTEKQLFDALITAALEHDKSVEIDLLKAFTTWTSQSGFPYLTVNIKNATMEIIQTQFIGFENINYKLWNIPINFATSEDKDFNNTIPKFWLTTKSISVDLNDYVKDVSDIWVIFNIQQTGYYRVNYDSNSWYQIIKALMNHHSEIHVANRAQLIDDVFIFKRKNLLSNDIFFKMLEYLVNEREYAPWAAFDNGIEFLNNALYNTSYYKNFLQLMQKILKPTVDEFIKLENKTNFNVKPLKSIQKEIIYRRSIEFSVMETKTAYFLNKMEYRQIFYCNQLKYPSAEKTLNNIIEEIFDLMKIFSDDPSVKIDLLKALGCINSESHIKILLLKISKTEIDPEFNLTSDEKLILLKSICREKKIGLQTTLEMILSRWQQLLIALEYRNFIDFLLEISKYIREPKLIEKFHKLIQDMDILTEDKLDIWSIIDENLEWEYVQKPLVVLYLLENYPITFNKAVTSELRWPAAYLLLMLCYLFLLYFN